MSAFLQSLQAGVPDAIDWLWFASARMAVLFVAVAAVSRIARWMGSLAQAALWRATLLSMALLCALPFGMPEGISLPSTVSFDPSPFRATAVTASTLETSPDESRPFAPSPAEHPVASTAPVWTRSIALIWLLGAVLHALHLALGARVLSKRIHESRELTAPAWTDELRRLCRSLNVRRPVRLVLTPWSGAPALAGWLRPVIMLPEGIDAWPTARRRAVLAHELSHVAHRDPWFTLTSAILRAVFWFHPAVRLTVRQMARYQELRCDGDAVRSGLDADEYALSLVGIARSNARVHRSALSMPFSQPSMLEERVRAILASASAGRSSHLPGLLVAIVAFTTAASALAIRSLPATLDSQPVWTQLAQGAERFLPFPSDLAQLHVVLSCEVRVLPAQEQPGLRIRAVTTDLADAFQERLRIEPDGKRLSIRDGRKSNDPGIVVEILAPSSLALDCLIHEGSLRCSAPLARLSGTTSLGPIRLASGTPPAGAVELLASNGSVTVDLPILNGSFLARCSLGFVDVTLRDPGSRGDLHLAVGRGDATLRLPDPESARFTTECPIGRTTLPHTAPTESVRLECQVQVGAGDLTVVRL